MILILTVCTTFAASDVCYEEAIPAPMQMAPMGCMLMAPATIAQWVDLHPSKTVKSWRCEAG